MSVEALNWTLQDACGIDKVTGAVVDVPSHLLPVLIGLANHADHQGKGAYPGQPLLGHYSRKSERGVRKDLAALLELKVIRRGDQRLVEHYPADKRPVVYNLAMERRRPGSGSDRNSSTYRQDPPAGTVVPPAPGQQVPPAHDRAEPRDRAEPQFRPEPDDRSSGSAPEHMDRNHSSARSDPPGTPVPVAGGTTVPPNRPYNQKMTSSSSSGPDDDDPSLVDKYSRSVAIIRQHLPDVDDDEAARLAEWIFRTYRPGPALLGAYIRRMALSGDLAAVRAERRAAAAAGGGPPAASPTRPASLIALDQRAIAVTGDDVSRRRAELDAQIAQTTIRYGPRTPADPPADGPDPPAAAAS